MKFDIVVIGAGVVGCAIARELSKLNASVCVVEAEIDACMGATSANSGIVHAGYDCKVGTLKARFNVRGCQMYARYCKELDVAYKNCGSLVVATESEQLPVLDELLAKGKSNGVPSLKIASGAEARGIEPSLSEQVISALYAPSAGIVDPYALGFALMENAIANGVRFKFNFRVAKISKKDSFTLISTSGDSVEAGYVINAAGVCSDEMSALAGDNSFSIMGRRGEYILYDKTDFMRVPIFPVPSSVGKGILIAPTVHGNMYVGPTGEDSENKRNVDTTKMGADKLLSSTQNVVPFNSRASITAFCGVRAIATKKDANGRDAIFDDFIIGESATTGFFNAAGICSPGLTSAPAIAEYFHSVFAELYDKNTRFEGSRESIKSFADASEEEKIALLKADRRYGNIICRCESISEAEIVQAVRRGACTVDGVKRRVRAGAGRCQGGFCMPKVLNIIARELNIPVEDVTKKGGKSAIVFGNVKEVRCE